jgi:hypothetical protein
MISQEICFTRSCAPTAAAAAEQLAAHGLADQADGRARAQLVVGEFAALPDFPVAGDEPVVGAAGDAAGPVAAVGHHGGAGARLGRHRRDAADLAGDGLGSALP